MELNEQRRDLWEVVRKYENQPFVQIGSSQGDSCSYKIYFQLYETLPLILNNSNNTNNTTSNIIYEDTTSLFPEVSV